MTNVYNLRDEMNLQVYNTAISRADFETLFKKTRETVRFTLNGWDGKSYNGESRNGTVYRATVKGYEEFRFVKVGKSLLYIDEEHDVLEKATGEFHKDAEWLVDILRA